MTSIADSIKVGSVVQLKSGGPEMTIIEIRDGYVECAWFSHDHTTHYKDKFSVESLVQNR